MANRSPDRKYKLFLYAAFARCKDKQKKENKPCVHSSEISDRYPYWFSYMQWAMADRLFHADGPDKYYPDESIEQLSLDEFSDLIWRRYNDD